MGLGFEPRLGFGLRSGSGLGVAAKTIACTSCAPCSVSNVMRACAPAGLACARACWLLLMPTRFSKKETTERLASRCCTC